MRGFFAYPSKPSVIGETIERAVTGRALPGVSVTTWPESDICGQFIGTTILRDFDDSVFLAADVTYLNFNVAFEVGYAIGRGKRLFLVANSALTSDRELADTVGVFDTLGYKPYATSDSLADLLGNAPTARPLLSAHELDTKAPLYYINAPNKTDYETRIKGRLKKSYLGFRSYDPVEDGRLQGPKAIADVSKALAVVCHLLPRADKGTSF
jgi:hypothetical protein